MNGVLGAETELAVLSFQQERNLSPATGISTPATLAALENGLAGRVAVPAVGISSSFDSPRLIEHSAITNPTAREGLLYRLRQRSF
jgi:peptidoglycan hydrolase-like protein with peptidoglycan-binding domain